LPSSSRKRLRVEVADEDEEEEEVDEEENPITKRRVVKQLSTKTRNALKQSLEISLARVHEASFYFYAMGANEEGGLPAFPLSLSSQNTHLHRHCRERVF
jgi:hypothetical protein